MSSDTVSTLAIESIHEFQSLHVTIVISGWLSECDDMKTTWSGLVDTQNLGMVYAYRWQSGKTIAAGYLPYK